MEERGEAPIPVRKSVLEASEAVATLPSVARSLAYDLVRRLERAAGQPVIIEHNGVRYRIEPEDPFAFYDPENALAAVKAKKRGTHD